MELYVWNGYQGFLHTHIPTHFTHTLSKAKHIFLLSIFNLSAFIGNRLVSNSINSNGRAVYLSVREPVVTGSVWVLLKGFQWNRFNWRRLEKEINKQKQSLSFQQFLSSACKDVIRYTIGGSNADCREVSIDRVSHWLIDKCNRGEATCNVLYVLNTGCGCMQMLLIKYILIRSVNFAKL